MSAAPDLHRAARRACRALEPLHSFVYFAPESETELLGTGLRPGRMPYLAQRSAAMGAVGPGPVTATFYNFSPDAVARALPRAWTLASPDEVLGARLRAVRSALGRLLDGADPAEIEEVTALVERVVTRCGPQGRALFAAHAALEVPHDPLERLWHAVTLLREFRGDGHVAALLTTGVSGLDALVTHTLGGRGFRPEFAAASRGWSAEQWQDAVARLTDHGLVVPGGSLSDAGRALREQVEVVTDATCAEPFEALDADELARLTTLGGSLSKRALAAGAFPAGVFAGS